MISDRERRLAEALRLLLQEVKADVQAIACIDMRIIDQAESALSSPPVEEGERPPHRLECTCGRTICPIHNIEAWYEKYDTPNPSSQPPSITTPPEVKP